jgi:hypothetical protein
MVQNGRIIANGELGRMLIEAVVTYFMALFLYFSGVSECNHKTAHTE